MWETFLRILNAGGPLMYVLSLIGVFISFLGLYQLSWLARLTNEPDKFTNHGVYTWAKKALEMVEKGQGLNGLSLMDSLEVCFTRMEDSMTWRVPEIRFLAQISTLTGFLGTVTGMVRVFDTVAKMGKATPADLAGGIHEALYTTVYGLVLALLAWFFAHAIEMLVRKHMRDLEVLVFSKLEEKK